MRGSESALAPPCVPREDAVHLTHSGRVVSVPWCGEITLRGACYCRSQHTSVCVGTEQRKWLCRGCTVGAAPFDGGPVLPAVFTRFRCCGVGQPDLTAVGSPAARLETRIKESMECAGNPVCLIKLEWNAAVSYYTSECKVKANRPMANVNTAHVVQGLERKWFRCDRTCGTWLFVEPGCWALHKGCADSGHPVRVTPCVYAPPSVSATHPSLCVRR